MRIAIIGDRGIPARYSGFSTLVEELSVRLVADYGMDVTVYCRSSYYDEHPSRYKGVRCVYLPAPGGKSFESIVHSNFAILHAVFRSYDLVFIVDPGNGPFAWPLALRRLPTAFHTDGLGWQRQKWSPLQRKYYKWAEKICARLASWLVTDSRAMQAYYREEYSAESTFIPYSGVVGDPPDPGTLDALGLAPQGYYLVVARMEPENNVHTIIKEYRKADTQRRLVVVGGNPYQTEYSRQVAEESDEKVLCLGSIFESGRLNALYANCYAYVHGHEVGGTNPSLLRAMHQGAACVPIDVVFHREVLGDENVYFSKQDGALAQILSSLDRSPERAAEMGRMAKSRADGLYRWDAVAAGYAELFQAMVHARRSRQRYGERLTGLEVYRPEEFCGAVSGADE